MALIGYAKLGRSYNLDPAKATSVGGDIDVLNLLRRLATDHPNDTIVLVGKNSGENPQALGYPANIVNPWTEWKKDWKMPTDPKEADMAIHQFRRLSGDLHEKLDALIIWAGQHGSANSRIPMIGSNWVRPPGTTAVDYDVSRGEESGNDHNDIITGGIGENLATPQYAFINYCAGILDFVSRWREAGPGPSVREEIWLCPDPRNYLKCREKRWPIRYPVLGQYDMLKYHKGERYGRFPELLGEYDPTGYVENSLWVSNVAYCYAGLELTAVGSPDTIKFDPTPGQHSFGMVVNENLQGGKDARLPLLKNWIIPNFPDAEIRGHWTEKSQIDLGRVITPVPYTEVLQTMKSFRTTITTPASSSGWATAKPWESFALGSVCFFHPRYDDQGHIIPKEGVDPTGKWYEGDADAEMLGAYLRVSSPQQLLDRVIEVNDNPDLFYALVTAQRRVYERAYEYWLGGSRAVSDRLNFDLARAEGGNGDENREPWITFTIPDAAKVSSRAAAIPRGTNDERKKKKPPISRRRALTEEALDERLREIEAAEQASTPPEEEAPVNSHLLQTLPDYAARLEARKLEMPATRREITGLDFIVTIPPQGFRFERLDQLPVSGEATPQGPRQSKDEYFLDIAKKVATQTTCGRRAVGCVLVNERKHILATGFNGVPRGMPHCNEGHACAGAGMPSGTGLSDCLSVHAEINALVQCSSVDEIETVYLTVSPCKDCIKVIMNTGARRIVFAEEYVHPQAKELWLQREGNEWIKL